MKREELLIRLKNLRKEGVSVFEAIDTLIEVCEYILSYHENVSNPCIKTYHRTDEGIYEKIEKSVIV